MTTSIHERNLRASIAQAAPLIDRLSSDGDVLWPSSRWPPMRLNRGLALGAKGGHGPIRYRLDAYEPGRSVRFRFTRPRGFDGYHQFDLAVAGEGAVRLRHTIEMRLHGKAHITWPLAIRWLHDALIEDALDQAEGYVEERPPRCRQWNIYVRCLRVIMSR